MHRVHVRALFCTLHSCWSELLAREKNGMVMVVFVSGILSLLLERPAAHVLQTLRRVSQLDQIRGLKSDNK